MSLKLKYFCDLSDESLFFFENGIPVPCEGLLPTRVSRISISNTTQKFLSQISVAKKPSILDRILRVRILDTELSFWRFIQLHLEILVGL
jgi:hypothetical protein